MSVLPRIGQRRSERNPAQTRVTLLIKGDAAWQFGNAVDLSRHGLRLESYLLLRPGQHLGLVLDNIPQYVIEARVVWVGKPDSQEASEVGLEFLRPLAAPV